MVSEPTATAVGDCASNLVNELRRLHHRFDEGVDEAIYSEGACILSALQRTHFWEQEGAIELRHVVKSGDTRGHGSSRDFDLVPDLVELAAILGRGKANRDAVISRRKRAALIHPGHSVPANVNRRERMGNRRCLTVINDDRGITGHVKCP